MTESEIELLIILRFKKSINVSLFITIMLSYGYNPKTTPCFQYLIFNLLKILFLN